MTGTEDARAARASARSWRRGGVGLIILCLLVFIPGLWTIPPVDRDESRFAQASRQMLESGTLEGWVVPKVQDKPRLNKPPLIYWLQASSARILGDAPGQWAWLDGGSENIWVYRVPSVLSAMAAVLLTWRLGVRMFDPRAAWLGAALLAVCPMVVWDAHQARADQLLLATTTATMMALWCVWSTGVHRGGAETRRETRGGGGFGWPIAFWLALSLGIMTKGPITPMVAALTCVALSLVSRQWRWLLNLRPLLGVLIVAGVVGPWVYLVGQEVGWSKYLSIVYDETIGRSAGAKEGHWGPPGYHIVLLGVLFWPGSLLTAAAIGRAWRRGMRRKVDSGQSRDRKGASAPERICGVEPIVSHGSDSTGSGAVTPTIGSTSQESTRAEHSTIPDAPSRSRLRLAWRSLRDARPSRPAELFLLAWMLPSWIVFELISTKLPHYTMPLYPAVALMSARALFGVRAMFLPSLGGTQRRRLAAFLANRDVKCPRCRYNLKGLTITNCPECNTELRIDRRQWITSGYATDRSQYIGRLLWKIIGIALVVGIPLILAIFVVTTPDDGTTFQWDTPVIVGGSLCIVIGAALLQRAARLFRRNRVTTGTIAAMCAILIAFGAIFGILLPRLNDLWVSRDVVRLLHKHGWSPVIPLGCFWYAEDSLIFLTRGKAQRLASKEHIGAWLREHPHVFLVSPNGLVFTPEMQQHRPDAAGPVRGFNYSIGSRVSVIILELTK